MEVWVRSQDKKFFGKIDNIYFLELDNFVFKKEPNSDKAIRDKKISYRLKCNGADLGEYPTKERCLEIIDKIQSLFCDFLVCRDVDFGDLDLKKELGLGGLIYHSKNLDEPTIEYHERSSIVYEMPKE